MALLGTGLLVGGCAVGIDAPDASAATRSACAKLVPGLPDQVADQSRRKVDSPRQGAAWGDPAIILRCGVGTPEGFTPSATCISVDGVGWYIPQDQLDSAPARVDITTIGRSPRVELSLPKAYLPPATALADLGSAVRTGTRETRPCQ